MARQGVMWMGAALALSAGLAMPAAAEEAGDGRAFAAVNDTIIRCPAQPPADPEQLTAQLETRPRDLDELSRGAQAFFNSDSDAGAAFRAAQAEQRANDWPFLCRYREANAVLLDEGTRPRAVFMGDSITEAWITADPDFFAGNGYVDRGISGQSSAQMVARFPADVIALRPQSVHIMAGTNDIGGATGPITEAEYLGNITAMIDMAQANGIAVVLAAIPPMSRLLPRPEFDVRPVVRQLNAVLARLAAEKDVAFIDYYSPLALEDGDFDPRLANDGVHPTRAGYAVMAPLAKGALAQVLEEVAR